MNNWKLRSTITGQDGMDFVEVNGHLSCYDQSEDCLVQIVPFGDKYPYYLRTSASDDFGPVSNQVPGICNGTFTHTGAASATVSSVVLEGEGTSTPNFTYTFLADGTLSTIVAAQGGDRNIRVGDKYQITTTAAHGSQVIEFRLVPGSNSRAISMRLIHDQGVLPYPVHRVKITETDEDHTIQVLDYRSSQVFPKPQDKLLDKYPDAAAAYGLRLLRSAYLGPAIRVRSEASGFPEIDVYFDSQGNLDTAALLDFAGTNSVRVTKWYDQSGNGKDASQTSTAAQPTIVGGGVLRTVNGKPALQFDGSDDSFNVNTALLYGQDRFDAYFHIESDNLSHIMFSESTSGGKYSYVSLAGSTDTNLHNAYGAQDVVLYVNGVNTQLVSGTNTRGQVQDAVIENGAKHSTGAIVVHEDALTSTWTNFKISAYASRPFDGKLTEMVLYNTDQSANREGIEKDMALHSGAFQVEDAPLLDAYGGAHAAYSLRKLNSDYTGAAIRVRRTSDSQEQDIGFDSNGNLDLTALYAFVGSSVGRTKIWYDQSGNGNDITQSASSAQPPITNSSGVVHKVDGVPALRFDGTNDAFPFDPTGLDIGNLSTFVTCKFSDTSGDEFALRLSGITGDKRWYAPLLQADNFRFYYGGASVAAETGANTNNNLHTMIAGATQGDMEAFVNGTSIGTQTLQSGIDATGTAIGGSFAGTNYMNGFIQEVIVYSSDQSERREGIERNISNHYDL